MLSLPLAERESFPFSRQETVEKAIHYLLAGWNTISSATGERGIFVVVLNLGCAKCFTSFSCFALNKRLETEQFMVIVVYDDVMK